MLPSLQALSSVPTFFFYYFSAHGNKSTLDNVCGGVFLLALVYEAYAVTCIYY